MNVRIIKQVLLEDTKDQHMFVNGPLVYRDIKMSFPPTIGLTITDGTWSAKITELRLDLPTGILIASTRPIVADQPPTLDKEESLIYEYVDSTDTLCQQGWEIAQSSRFPFA